MFYASGSFTTLPSASMNQRSLLNGTPSSRAAIHSAWYFRGSGPFATIPVPLLHSTNVQLDAASASSQVDAELAALKAQVAAAPGLPAGQGEAEATS